jgi:glc operon protein GlcG
MLKVIAAFLTILPLLSAVDLPSKKILNLAAIKTMVAAAESEAARHNVRVTICIVDDAGNLLFLERGDNADLITLEFAQKKARHAALYKSASKSAQDSAKANPALLALPEYFPNQGGLPIKVDGQTLGGIAVSGAPSEIDEAIGQFALDALLKP